MVIVVDPAELAQEFVLIATLLKSSKPDQPVLRWLEYQAYTGFTRYVIEKGELPDGFDLFTPEAKSLQEWIAGKKNLPKSFIKELRRLLLALQAAGSGIIDDLCRFYCEYKTQLSAGVDAATLLLTAESIKAILIAYGGDILFAGGIPITAFAALLIEFGLLEKICECP
jgi:hypothetical protein